MLAATNKSSFRRVLRSTNLYPWFCFIEKKKNTRLSHRHKSISCIFLNAKRIGSRYEQQQQKYFSHSLVKKIKKKTKTKRESLIRARVRHVHLCSLNLCSSFSSKSFEYRIFSLISKQKTGDKIVSRERKTETETVYSKNKKEKA